MKTILYTTDYSNNSVAALKYAKKLCAVMQSRLLVGHVFGYPVVSETMVAGALPELRKNVVKANHARLEDFCIKHLGKEWKKMNVQVVPVEDLFVLDGIIGTANDWNAELIVVGTRGESAVQELFLGSTTKQLIKKAPCPVLAIPSDASYLMPKTIVYATDFEGEDVYAIKKVTELAERFDAEIKVVHISTKKEYAGETQMEWFKDMLLDKVDYQKLEFELVFSEDIFETLRAYLGDEGADLVVMLERKNSGFLKKWFHRDTVARMESYGRVPLLTFNEANQKILHF